jgi:hypothetical protein
MELVRGLRMVACRRSTPMRNVVAAVLYEAVDRELQDWPEWRYQTKRGEEHLLYADGRKAAGLKRRKKKPVRDEEPAI